MKFNPQEIRFAVGRIGDCSCIPSMITEIDLIKMKDTVNSGKLPEGFEQFKLNEKEKERLRNFLNETVVTGKAL